MVIWHPRVAWHELIVGIAVGAFGAYVSLEASQIAGWIISGLGGYLIGAGGYKLHYLARRKRCLDYPTSSR